MNISILSMALTIITSLAMVLIAWITFDMSDRACRDAAKLLANPDEHERTDKEGCEDGL